MAEFRVVIDEVELSDEHHQKINAAIQRAVLPHLADFGVDVERPIVAIPDKRFWRGIWIGPIRQEILDEHAPQLKERFGG